VVEELQQLDLCFRLQRERERRSQYLEYARTPRPCSVCGAPRLCRRRERRLIGARFGRWREERFGRARCLTLRYSLLLSVWVDSSAVHKTINSQSNIYIQVYIHRFTGVLGSLWLRNSSSSISVFAYTHKHREYVNILCGD